MAGGAGAIALASVHEEEHGRWRQAAQREGKRYGVDATYLQAGLAGEDANQRSAEHGRRTWLDVGLIVVATAVFVGLAAVSRPPEINLDWNAVALLAAAMLIFLAACGIALWKITRFN